MLFHFDIVWFHSKIWSQCLPTTFSIMKRTRSFFTWVNSDHNTLDNKNTVSNQWAFLTKDFLHLSRKEMTELVEQKERKKDERTATLLARGSEPYRKQYFLTYVTTTIFAHIIHTDLRANCVKLCVCFLLKSQTENGSCSYSESLLLFLIYMWIHFYSKLPFGKRIHIAC